MACRWKNVTRSASAVGAVLVAVVLRMGAAGANAPTPPRTLSGKGSAPGATVCVTRLEDGRFTLRLTGFKPESRYNWRAVDVPYGVSGSKVDSDGTTDHASGLHPPHLKRATVPNGLTVIGIAKDGKSVRLRIGQL